MIHVMPCICPENLFCIQINIIYVHLKFHCNTIVIAHSVVVSVKFLKYTHN